MISEHFIENHIKRMAEVEPGINDLLYWNKISLFVDVLGFKNLIHSNSNLAALESNILPLLRQIDTLTEQNNIEDWGTLVTMRQITTFSDSIVASYLMNPASIEYLLLDITTISQVLINNGLLFRGGIAFEKLYHLDREVVGEGLIRAHKIESREAVYPRIVFDGPVIRAIRSNCKRPMVPSWWLERINKSICLDSDRKYIIDIAHLLGPMNCTNKLHQIVDQSIGADRRVLRKMQWIKRYLAKFGEKEKIVSKDRFSPASAVYV